MKFYLPNMIINFTTKAICLKIAMLYCLFGSIVLIAGQRLVVGPIFTAYVTKQPLTLNGENKFPIIITRNSNKDVVSTIFIDNIENNIQWNENVLQITSHDGQIKTFEIRP